MRDENLLALVRKKLSDAGIEDAAFEARQIVLEADCERTANEFVNRRIGGEPLQYILGCWEFYGLPFYVGQGVLIPRPDTETLVDAALGIIGKSKARVLDLCSGSGAVAVAIAENSSAEVTALEKSDAAYAYLLKNIERNGASVRAVKGDVFDGFNGEYDLIVSNPPYIKSDVIPTLSREVKREPTMALDGGEDGLIFYRRIAEYWTGLLAKGGTVAVEIGFDQQEQVSRIFAEAGLDDIRCVKDLSSNPRVIIGTLRSRTT